MSDFDTIWTTGTIGDSFTVSNGQIEPSIAGSLPWRHWRSHNFTGMLVEKVEGAVRCLRFRLPPEAGATVTYEVSEAVEHTFTAA